LIYRLPLGYTASHGIASEEQLSMTGMPTTAPDRGAMSVDQFADWSGICKTLVWREIKEGRLKARRITKRRVVILPGDADAFMNALPIIGEAA
jgi:hypothetical protein